MAITKSWKVYGAEGHRQRESFNKSYRYDFSNETDGTRIIEVENSDKTGTNDYSLVHITRDTIEDCINEFEGQLTDGIFENSRTGYIEEVITNEQTLHFKAEDCNNPLWDHIIEVLRKHDSTFDGVMYCDGDHMAFRFKEA